MFPGDNCWGINAGFWTQVGYHTEGTNGFGDGLMNDYPNHVQLHQQWFFLEKAVDTGGCGFDWGFRADYVYGTDGPGYAGVRQSARILGTLVGTTAVRTAVRSRSCMPSWASTISRPRSATSTRSMGYEVIPATGNFFYSHAFEFYISEPFTHTGVLLEQKVTDDITVLGGWTAGWDTGFRTQWRQQVPGRRQTAIDRESRALVHHLVGRRGLRRQRRPGSDQNGYMHTLLFNWNAQRPVDLRVPEQFRGQRSTDRVNRGRG